MENALAQQPLPAQEIIERLKNTLHVHTDSDLAAALGVSPQAISKARKQERIPRRWLHLLQQRSPGRAAQAGMRNKDSLVFIPMVQDRLGTDGRVELCRSLNPYLPMAATMASAMGNPDSMFCLEHCGDSMAPALLHGDLALVDQSQTQLHGFGLYAVSIEGALFIRQLDLAPGKLILRCLNPRYEPLTAALDAPEPRLIGRVLWTCRNLL